MESGEKWLIRGMGAVVLFFGVLLVESHIESARQSDRNTERLSVLEELIKERAAHFNGRLDRITERTDTIYLKLLKQRSVIENKESAPIVP